jgi:hypothetical protein
MRVPTFLVIKKKSTRKWKSNAIFIAQLFSRLLKYFRMNSRCIFVALGLFSFNICFAQSTTGDIKVDTTITGFTLAENVSGTMIYTPNGKADLTSSTKPSAFAVTLMRNKSYFFALKQVMMLMDMSKRAGYKFSNTINKDTLIHGDTAFYVSLTETIPGAPNKNLNFFAFFIEGGNIVFFTGGDLDDGKYIDRIKKTFYSIKI